MMRVEAWIPGTWARRLAMGALAGVVFACGAGGAAAQGVVEGRVTSGDGVVPFATIAAPALGRATVADADGAYVLAGVDAGSHELTASAPGHASVTRLVTVHAGRKVRLDFVLPVAAITSDPIVVTGTRREIRLSESPVKVEVVRSEYLNRRPTSGLADALEMVNGLSQQIDCGVCYTSGIRINGLDGPYTAVLIDGAPIMGALAAVYGLNGIDPSLIEQVEVVKGPASTLHGPEAMAGVVNVITKDPRFAPRLAVHGYASGDGELNLDVAASPRTDRFGVIASANLFRMNRFLDRNADGFSDVPLQDRLALFGKLTLPRDGRDALDVFGRFYVEDRFGGVEDWTPADRGSGTVYGESILTRRWEMVGRYVPPAFERTLAMDFSLSRHVQDSWYGATEFHARQVVGHANAAWAPRIGVGRDLLLGAALRHQRYDDDTPATMEPERRWIPAVFAQAESRLTPTSRVLGGLRLDHHDAHGWIVSPRFNLRWDAAPVTAVRLNAGTGFRVVNLFTEDHAALTGSREVVIEGPLRPERSASVALNLNHALTGRLEGVVIDADAFWTRFSNRIIPDYDQDPILIVYRNLDGISVSRGLALSLTRTADALPLTFNVGGTWMQVFSEADGVRTPQLHAPSFQGVYGVSWAMERADATFDLLGRAVGPMALPHYPEPFTRPTQSGWYSVHHLKATRHFHGRFEFDLYAAVDNVFGYSQPSPLIDPGNPFGDDFDTAYVYAPLRGRALLVGLRYGVAK